MARLAGFIANRPDLCNRFAEHERDVLSVHHSGDEPWGWGVGFLQGGELLLKRRPFDDRKQICISDMIAELRSDLLLTHVRRATVGALGTNNTHPFRYRHWMFADTGTLDGFGEIRATLLETLPRFLQRSLRGETDSELFFHLFLSFLHDAGKLDRQAVPPKDVFAALKSCMGLVERMAQDAGLGASQLNIVLTAPEYVIAARRGPPMAYRVLAGREDFEPYFEDSGPSKMRMPDLEPCRLCVVASNFRDDEVPDDWTELPDKSMIAFSRTDEPIIVSPS